MLRQDGKAGRSKTSKAESRSMGEISGQRSMKVGRKENGGKEG